MATKKKMLEAAAGSAGGDTLDITDVFSTYLYDGTNVAQTITNGIDLAGEGGLVWQKLRAHPTPPDGQDHYLRDTERGVGKRLRSNSTAGETNDGGITSVNSDGFALSSGTAGNLNGATYASWTFRKAPKFFDVVTYTGDGTSNRQIAHNINGTVGTILIKRLDNGNWLAWHRSVNPGYGILDLNLAFTAGANGFFDAVTDTYLETSWLNTSGVNYVVYLFAHNDSGDGEFGPDGDQDIIKCGSFTSDSSGDVAEIDLGFEPQWIMLKRTSGTGDWRIGDVMRGDTVDNSFQALKANTSDAESTLVMSRPTATGYKIDTGFGTNATGIYMAIRRGPLAPPTAATEVFGIDTYGSTGDGKTPALRSPFVTDMYFQTEIDSNDARRFRQRLTGNKFLTATAAAESGSGGSTNFAFMNGVFNYTGSLSDNYGWMWKRAPSFFDAVAYSGSTSIQNISHNLDVQPEMIWIKNRTWSGTSWTVLFTSLGARKYLSLDTADGAVALPLYNGTDFFANTLPTSSVFTVGGGTAGGGYDNVGSSGLNYIAYLFATLAGVSKVGSVTHSGTTNVDCGFSAGARFVLLKRTDATGDWYLWDSVRGIIAGNDPYLLLNSIAAQVTNTDYIDPLSSGFTITSNFTAGDYIFYAIA
tara:strand:+ start:61 stop:1989 length:1929 start_codon:yes stop_codon:yes gene_type:complete